MPGVNPALLAQISGAPGGAPPPGSPGSTPSTGEIPEEGGLHTACLELCETVKAAVEMATDLQSQAEMADEIDPAAERAIGQAAKLLMQASELLEKAEGPIGEAHGAGDPESGSDAGGDVPPPA